MNQLLIVGGFLGIVALIFYGSLWLEVYCLAKARQKEKSQEEMEAAANRTAHAARADVLALVETEERRASQHVG